MLDILGQLAAADGPVAQRVLTAGRARAADVAKLVEAGFAEYALESGKARVSDRTIRVAQLVEDVEPPKNLERSPARKVVLEALRERGGTAEVSALREVHPRASDHLRALEKQGLVRIEKQVVRRDAWGNKEDQAEGMIAPTAPLSLNEAQEAAVARVKASIDEGIYRGHLLHGITGSGKTEVYLHIISHCLELGKNAIVLVPEISLTPQLAARFRARFGPQVAVLHSGLSDRDRFDEWHRLREGRARIALGARSAVFAPLTNVGVIVVDEEHDSSFKQEEGVRYNARDVALVRAARSKAVCVLGSATPSLESFHGATSGRLELLSLPNRATGQALPKVELVDMRRFKPDSQSLLTAPLAEAISEALSNGQQTILFLNRRGFDTFVMCTGCGHAFRCHSCSVSLTYHRFRERLVCHYCGHEEALPSVCPSCSSPHGLSRRGYGTEKIAAAVAERFADARVERLDRDVASGGDAVQRILGRVARREVDILVGTQMVTKGHDFPGVTVVGVLCADTGLSLPDFRASERTFQLLAQVAGRAGRGEVAGRVLVQTYRAEALAVACAVEHDYMGFYEGEIREREELGYPPFGHLVALRVDGPESGAVIRQCRLLADAARGLGLEDLTILGPSEAPLARLRGRTRWHLWLRSPARPLLRSALKAVLKRVEKVGGTRVTADVDPLSAL
jgi:primosomal protein N' (replication factor Y)